jgi:hypothetical protein
MEKYYLKIYQGFLALLLVLVIIFSCVFLTKSDQIVTEKITLDYFETSLNHFTEEKLKEFSADSENDVLYKNLVNAYSRYRADGISDYQFKIDKYEVFGTGKYQCYFNLKGIPTCDLEHEGRYMNYLLDTTTTFTNAIGEVQVVKEKGIVVFIKDGSNGNPFEWKLVRYNTYVI